MAGEKSEKVPDGIRTHDAETQHTREEMETITEYMTPQTRLPPYLPFARFLLKTDLSLTAKIVYSLLLDRMTLSQKKGWTDEQGHIFIIYPVEKIAEDIDRGQTSVKSALTELAARGLIDRRRIGFSGPNRIYVKLPDGRYPDSVTVGNAAVIQPENRRSYSQSPDSVTVGNPTDNYLSHNDLTQPTDGTMPRAVFGRYENVFLTSEEYDTLKTDCPEIDSLIERLPL